MTDRALALLTILGLLVCFAGPDLAEAQPAPAPASEAQPAPADPADDLPSFGREVLAAARAGHWLLLGALLLGGLVSILRRKSGWLATKFKWLQTDRGGAVLALSLGVLADVAAALVTHGQAPPGATGGLVAALAAGGRALLRGLLAPKDQRPTPGLPL